MGLLDNKIIMVTGAGSGIGRASALLFAQEGAAGILVTDVDDERGQETVTMIESAGGTAHYAHCDVSDEDQVSATVRTAVEQYGRLDGAYNNAGLGHGQERVADIDRAGWDRTLNVNLTGTWLCMKYQIQQFLTQGTDGAIVNQSSATGLVGWPLVGGYGATKAAVAHLTKITAAEYATDGIRVNAIAPGPIETEMVARAIQEHPETAARIASVVPLGRIGRPSEVGEAAAWLLSSRASFVTGVTLSVDGGQVSRG
jgi:NAD(P)-dependent dehydrogenase (short-subunit alcohol dehydrogenase family)